MSAGARVSILVVNWNTRELALRCLDSLPAGVDGAFGYEVILVENGSRDGSAGALAERRDITLLENAENRGYAAAVNQAYACAGGELVLLLNSDVEVVPGALGVLVRFLSEHEEIAGVAPVYQNPDGSPQHFHFRLPTFYETLANSSALFRIFWEADKKDDAPYLIDEDFAEPQPVPQPSASCLLLRRSYLPVDRVFDERFPIFFNDVQLARSLGQEGRELWVTPDAVVYHDAHASTRQLGGALRRQYLGSLVRMLRDTEPAYRVGFYRALMLVQGLLMFVLRRPGALGPSELWRALAGDVGPLPQASAAEPPVEAPPPPEGQNLAQKIFVNTGVQVVARIAGLAASLVVLRMMTSYLGVDGFGQLSIILALGGVLAALSDFGITTTLAREIAKAPHRVDELGGDLLRFRVLSSVLMALGALLLLPVLPYVHQTKVGFALSLAGVVLASVATFPNAFFQTNLRLDLQAAIDLLRKVLNLGAIGIVAAFDLGFYTLIVLLVVVNAVDCATAFVFSRRFWHINVRFDWARAKPLIRDAVGIGAAGMIALLHFRGDAILLSLLKPASDVGIYTIAYRFVDQAFFLPGIFVAAVFPILTRYIHNRDARRDTAINRSFQVLVLAGLGVAIMCFTMADPFVRLVSGDQFLAAIQPLRILALSVPFLFASPVFYNVLISTNHQRDLIVISSGAVVFNMALNLALIPPYTYNGAAVATVASEAASFLAWVVISRRRVDFKLDLVFALRVAAAVLAVVVVVGLTWTRSAWLAFVLAELTFLACAYGLKTFTRDDLKLVFQRRATAP